MDDVRDLIHSLETLRRVGYDRILRMVIWVRFHPSGYVAFLNSTSSELGLCIRYRKNWR